MRCTIRVLLPHDSVLRLECGRQVTAASLKDYIVRLLEEQPQVENCCEPSCNQIRVLHQSGGRGVIDPASQARLLLVRSGIELDGDTLVAHTVRQFDILEVHVDADKGSFEGNDPAATGSHDFVKSQNIRHPDINRCKTYIRARPTVHFKKKSKQSAHCGSSSIPDNQRRRNININSRKDDMLQTEVGEHRTDYEIEGGSVYTVLRGGLELVRRLLVIKEEMQRLVLLLRDAEYGGVPATLERMVPLIARISAALYQADGGATLDRWHAANTRTSLPSSASPSIGSELGLGSAIRTLALTAGGAGAASRGSILMQGWVVSTEWRGIWRHQFTEYACLCDDHTLYLFATRQLCVDHIFELARARDGDATETSARILKASAPRRKVNLSEGKWTVRRAEMPRGEGQPSSDQQQRQAFALFDTKSGEMRLIVDVTTPREAEQWALAIQNELNYNTLYSRMRTMHNNGKGSLNSTNGMNRQGITVPLRWLHARLDRLDGKARSERMQSRNFTQAIKDLQRDRITIDGIMYPGANVERVLVALTTRLLSLMDGRYRSRSPKSTNLSRLSDSSSAGLGDTFVAEFNALCFARQLVISCSRTIGGGDILDTLHLMFNKERFCICPDPQQSSPIELRLHGRSGNGGQIHATVTLSMVYKIVSIESISSSSESNNNDSSNEATTREQRVIATYTQQLTGAALEWREVDGSVCINLT